MKKKVIYLIWIIINILIFLAFVKIYQQSGAIKNKNDFWRKYHKNLKNFLYVV